MLRCGRRSPPRRITNTPAGLAGPAPCLALPGCAARGGAGRGGPQAI